MMTSTVDLLACPECRGRLQEDGTSLICESCGTTFPVGASGPRLLPRSLGGQAWGEWDEKQALGEKEYRAESEAQSSDAVAAEFGRFARLRGIVLDIGCGVHAERPAYAHAPEIEFYVGVDPLEPAAPPRFEFVQGIGEQLPLADGSFDRAVSATALDHVVDPEQNLREARRVLKPDGSLAAWIGVVDEAAVLRRWSPPFSVGESFRAGGPRGLAGHLWYWALRAPLKRLSVRLRYRRNADDVIREAFPERMKYHFHFFRRAQFLALLEHCGFDVLETRLLRDKAHGDSLFVLARPTEAH
jgi:SAM-dependent methyltransferase